MYEVASGVVLRNRTVSGSSTVLSMAPDGSRFMAGMTMYDTATLAVMAQQNNANAPFTFTGAFNTLQNVGGSVFTADGSTLYSAFNTAANSVPTPPPLASTLLINDPTNLAIRLGIRLPESIVAKMVMLSDGSEAWGLSDSGMIHLPLGRLYEYPILQPETTTVFLANDDCNRGVASGVLKMNNLGKGRLTFSVVSTGNSALVYQQSSGLAPANITFTLEPGRSGVVRQPGTNLWTGAGTQQGTPFNITLSSPEAINVPPVIRVYMNYRQSDQRGVIYPVPTTPNGTEGLMDIQLDEKRGRVYITNSGYNRIEVFDIQKQHFIDPIPVGQLPHSMAMGSDGNILYVGNTGGESISIVDLDLGKVVDSVQFPPIPRNGTAALIYPRTLANGVFGLQFVMSDGSQWKVVSGNQATVRPADSVTPVRLAGAPNYRDALHQRRQVHPDPERQRHRLSLRRRLRCLRLAAAAAHRNDSGLLRRARSGTRRLLFPDGRPDSELRPDRRRRLGAAWRTEHYHQSRRPRLSGRRWRSRYHRNHRQHRAAQRGIARGRSATPPSCASPRPVRQTITTATRDDSRTTLEMINLITGEDQLIGVAPENPVTSVFGTTRSNVQPRMMVVDSAGTTAYAITLSGLSVISLAPTGSNTRPTIAAGARGVVNSADGTAEDQAGLVHHHQREQSRRPCGRRFTAATHRARRVLCDLRRCRSPAAGDVHRRDPGPGPGYPSSRHSGGRSPLAGHRPAERSDHDHRARQLVRFRPSYRCGIHLPLEPIACPFVHK